MTTAELKVLVMFLTFNYPEWGSSLNIIRANDFIAGWKTVLGEEDFEKAGKAVAEYMETQESPPNPEQIKYLIREMEDEFWESKIPILRRDKLLVENIQKKGRA